MAHKFEPLKKEPAYLKVYKAVEAEILSGTLREGAVLQTEAELCEQFGICLLYTSPSPRDRTRSRMPSSA